MASKDSINELREARKKKEEKKSTTAWQTMSPATAGRSSIDELREQRAQQSKATSDRIKNTEKNRNTQTTQRKTTPTLADSKMIKDLALQRMKQAQMGLQKVGGTSVGKSASSNKTTSHSSSSGTWADNSNSAYKQWAANNPAMAKAQEARSTVANKVQETSKKPAQKSAVTNEAIANFVATSNARIDQSIAELEKKKSTVQESLRQANLAVTGWRRNGAVPQAKAAQQRYDEIKRQYDELESQIIGLERNKESNKKALKISAYQGVMALPDFEEVAKQGAAIANPNINRVYAGEKTRHASGIGAQYMQTAQTFDDVQNKVSFVRDNWDNLAPHLQEWLKDTPYGKYRHMGEDEVNTYNYLLAKDGKEAADEYLDFIEETLNWHEGTEIGEKRMSVKNDVLRTTLNTLYGLGAVGPDQWMSGTTQLLSSERLPTSATQFAGQYIRENADPVEKFFFDAGTVTGNMLPSILISKGTGLVGSALGWGAKAVGTASTIAGAAAVGSSASGNAYNQALDEGYTKEEARKYATLVGASEAGLSAVLGSNLVGGKVNGLLKARIQGIDNALGRIAGHWALSTGGEVTEEVLQEYLEPAFRTLIFDVDYDAPNFEEVAYVALLTALSAGAPGAVDAVATEKTNSRTGKSVQASEGGVKGLLDGALALDPSTESHKKATALMNKKGEPNDAEIGDLKRTFAIDSIKADKDRLKAETDKAKQFGEDSKASKTAARIDGKLVKGEEVSDEDIAELLTDNAVAENEVRGKQRAADADALVENAPAVEELVQQGRDLGGRASKEAERIASKVANGVEVTSNDIQRLMEANENTKTAVDKYTKRVIDNAVARKITNYGEHGAQAFADAVNTSNGQDIRDVQLDFDTPYQAGLMNKNRNTVTLDSPLAKLAYNAGVQDYIAQNKADKAHTPSAIYSEKDSVVDWSNAPSDITHEQKSFGEFMVKHMGLRSDFSSKEEIYNAVFSRDTGKVTFDAGFGIDPRLVKRLGNIDYQKKVERLAAERGQSVTTYIAEEIAVHRAMDLAPVEMRAFVNAMYEYKQNGSEVNLARDKQSFYSSRGVDLDTYGAMEEVVGDSLILDLYDGDENAFVDAMYRIGNGTNESAKKGARTFVEMLTDTIKRLKAWMQKLTGRENAELKSNIEQSVSELENLRNMFEKAIATSMDTVAKARKSGNVADVSKLSSLTETTSADGTVVMTDKNGNPVAMMTEDGSSQFNLKVYKESGRDAMVKWLDKRVSDKLISKEEAADIVKQMDEFYEICEQFVDKYAPFGTWSNAEVVKGKNGKPAFSVVKANGDYAMNLDFSLVCKKRRTLDAVFGEMIKRGIMDDVVLEESDIVRINDVIRESGFETACALCFVDSKRYRQAMVADNFVNKYNELVETLIPEGSDVSAHYFNYVGKAKDNVGKGLHSLSDAEIAAGIKKLKKVMRDNGAKTVPHKIAKHLLAHPEDRKFVRRSDFMNTDGFEEVSINNPNVMKLYNSSKGSGGPKAAFSDVQYLGEILSKTNFAPERAYAVGGVRIQSFSDYIPRLVFDYLQMIGDLSAKKLPAHAYTKEALFAMQFGMTGVKVNMSLVPAIVEGGVAPGLDANGDYAWFDGQSFGSDVNVKGSAKTGFDLAVKIQNANGYSANCGTIAVGISDQHILKMLNDPNIRMVIPYHKSSLNHIVAVMNSIDKYDDYTGVQNTRYADTGKKIETKDFNYNEALRRTGDAKAAAEEYKAWCAKNNFLPKFDKFAWHENYYKLLEDFSTYDNGVAAPQGPVTMTFPKEGDAFGSMSQLIEQGLEEDAFLEARRDKNLSKIVDEIEGVLAKKSDEQFSLKGNAGETAQKNTTTESGVDVSVAKKNFELAPINQELYNLVAKVKSGNFNPKDRVDLGIVPDDIARRIFEATGVNPKGYRMVIEARQIEHILKRHGEDGKSNRSMADDNDIAKIGFVFDSPDSIIYGGRTNAYTHMRSGHNKTAPTVLYEKSIGEQSYYVVQAVPDTKAKTVFVVTAFIDVPGYQGQKKEVPQLINAKRPDETPKSGSVDTSAYIIAQEEGNGNRKNSIKGEYEFREELKRIRNEGKKKGKSEAEIRQEVDEYVNELRAENERASTQYSRDAAGMRMHPERWTAERVGDTDKTPMSLSDIVAKIRHDFDLNITTGHIRGEGVRGQYNLRDKGIRTRVANNLPTVAHELGHALDDRYSITKNIAKELKDELSNGMDEGFKAGYKKSEWVSEGYAEFVRKFLQNRETTAIDYPEFTKHFLNSMSGKDAALIETLADEINAYYSLDADSATSAIKFREEGATDFRTIGEKIKEKANVLYQEWVDSNRGIKKFDDATGTSTYKLASNAAYADAIAGQVIIGDLTDANGRYVAPGLKTALHGLNLKDKKEYRLFGEYLAVKHGPERLAEGQRIFADDRKNSTAFMERRRAELEEQFPHFAEISDRLYAFERDFLQTWGVQTGLVSAEAAKSWSKRWSFYVPLNRAVSMDKRGIGAKRGFANQNSTIKKAHGSGLDIVHPVDNIINNIVKMVNAGVRNNVMRSITDAAQNFGADAMFLEKIPTTMTKQGFDMSGVKDNLIGLLEGSGLTKSGKNEAEQIVLSLDDILYQYGKGKAHGDVITVMKNGEQEFWKVNDAMLLSSITNMSQKSMDGILDAYAVVSRFMTSNITGNNIVWALFSNFPRDLQTFFVYSKNKNPIKALAAMGSAYANKVKGDNADPLYKEYLAMGGGQTSAYTADRDLAKRAREKLKGKNISANPIDWLSFMSNIIEAGPRFATYKLMRDAGLNPQEAFYEAMDITVNFRRGGRLARQTNKVVPFFNASVQGLDKFRRWITASDVHTSDRKKAVRGRMIAFVAVSAALGALTYGINNGDDEAEENYEQLSNHTKNSFWCFPMGDGKYFAIPKPREIGVLSSFFETTMEYGIGDNDRAFDGFYDYVTNNALPSFAADVAQGDLYGVIGNLGIVGTGAYMMANRDFLGRPIVSASMQNLEPKDQYTDRTSKIAYWVGQAFDVSPTMVDYFFNSTLGGWHKAQKALFPVGGENVDLTLGVQNTYVKDNQYSQDLTNWLYDKFDTSQKAHNSDRSNMEKAIDYVMDSRMTEFYSRYNKLSKNLPETTSTRATRQTVLNMILEYQKASDNGYTTKAQDIVYAICKKQGNTELLPAAVNTYVKDGGNKTRNLSAAQYVEYQTDYNRRYWEYVEDNLSTKQSQEEQLAVLKAAKQTAEDAAKDQVLARIGAPKTKFSSKFDGVNYDDIVNFRASVDLADEDGLKQDEVKDIILDMIRDGLSEEDAYTLFHSRYESDKNNPWRRYK